MSGFDGLWKHQNNTASTKSVGVFKILKLDTIQETNKKGFLVQNTDGGCSRLVKTLESKARSGCGLASWSAQ